MSTTTAAPTNFNIDINKFDWKTIVIIVLIILLVLILLGIIAPRKTVVVAQQPFTQTDEQQMQYQY